ncbi:hypothetical protein BZM26_00430 [Paraburkholderia strydomiana]|nr:hypothetical protein BZM26_00430 [Paraburkholderia strydomiana]
MKLRAKLAAALLASTIAGPSLAQSPQPWKFAALLPLTGVNAGYSLDLKLGYEIAVEDINQSGGIEGRPVQLTMMDTQSNPGQVATLIRQACNDALIVVGPALSHEAQVGFPVANSMQCPSFAPAAPAIGLTASNRPWTFSFATPVNVTTPVAIDFITKKLKPKKVALIVEKEDNAATSYAQLIVKALAHDSIPVDTLSVSSKDVDFGPQINRAASANADLLILATLDRSAVGLLKELRKSRSGAHVMLTQSAYNALVGSLPPDILEGVYRYAQADLASSPDPRVKAFIKKYESRSGGRAPSWVAALPYDLMMMTKTVMERGGLKGDAANRASDRKKFIETLAAVRDWTGLTGTVSMTPEGYVFKLPQVLVSHGGKWELVKD